MAATRVAFQAYGAVAERGEGLEVASRPAAEIEDRERRLALDGAQQRFDVLADVVIARAFAEILGMPVVVLQRDGGDFFQVLLSQMGILLLGCSKSQCEGAGTAGMVRLA